jgi:hypothetical protein
MPQTTNRKLPEVSQEELIQGARRQFADSAARLLEGMSVHSPCRCQEAQRTAHEIDCPIAIWHRAARAVRMLAED